MCVVCGYLSVVLVWPALLSLPAAFAARREARRDLAKIEAGRMDPQGAGPTQAALDAADVALALSLLGLFSACVYALVSWAF